MASRVAVVGQGPAKEIPAPLPDPVALARGYARLKLARVLSLVAGVMGAVGLVVFDLWVIRKLGDMGGFEGVCWGFRELVRGHFDAVDWAALALVPSLVLGLLLMWRSRVNMPARGTSDSDNTPPCLRSLARQIEACARQLECGADRAFDADATELGLELSSLDASTREYLDDRSANHNHLRTILSELESRRTIAAKQRRFLHAELLRLAAAVRGRPCGDPYRSRITSGRVVGLEWLRGGSPLDPALRRTRRRHAMLLLGLSILWVVLTSYIYGWVLGMHPAWCNPFGQSAQLGACSLSFSIRAIRARNVYLFGLLALGLLPALAVVAARLTRRAAQRSFCLALPEEPRWDAFEATGSTGFASARRRIVVRKIWIAQLTGLFAGMLAVALPVAYVWFLEHDHGFGRGHLFGLGLIIGLAVVSFGPVRARVREAIENARLRAARRRCKGPVVAERLSELAALRSWFARTVPRSAQPLESLVGALRESAGEGALESADVERVCGLLELAIAGGRTLGPARVQMLTRELETCEALLIRPAAD